MVNSGVGASGSTYIEFDDVEVPVENLLGRENQGFEIIMSSKFHLLPFFLSKLGGECEMAQKYIHSVF